MRTDFTLTPTNDIHVWCYCPRCGRKVPITIDASRPDTKAAPDAILTLTNDDEGQVTQVGPKHVFQMTLSGSRLWIQVAGVKCPFQKGKKP